MTGGAFEATFMPGSTFAEDLVSMINKSSASRAALALGRLYHVVWSFRANVSIPEIFNITAFEWWITINSIYYPSLIKKIHLLKSYVWVWPIFPLIFGELGVLKKLGKVCLLHAAWLHEAINKYSYAAFTWICPLKQQAMSGPQKINKNANVFYIKNLQNLFQTYFSIYQKNLEILIFNQGFPASCSEWLF